MKRKLFAIALVLAVASGAAYYYTHHDHPGHGESAQLYTCPMHPQIVQEGPGSCPICGMKLVPMKNENKKQASGPEGLAPVTVDEKTRGMLGIVFEKVSLRPIGREVRSPVTIVPDETRLYRITTKVAGWVEKLYVNQTGQFVRKGDPLLSIYSPDLYSAQQEYLAAVKARAKAATIDDKALSGSLEQMEAASRERLALMDVSQAQIERLARTGAAERAVVLYSPSTGYVSEKSVLPGQQIMMNDALMVVADLSRVWGEIVIYESDLQHVRTGTPVKVTLPSWPGRVFSGSVSFMDAFLNPETRTLRARIVIPNSGADLRPGMYGEAQMVISAGRKTAVPESAVVRTGARDYVFVRGGGDDIDPREVTLGARSGDGYYEVVSGLKAGESVVSSATFMIDSESSLKAALEAASKAR